MVNCKVTFTDTNFDRYSVTSPKTGRTLYVSQGWRTNDTDVFTKIVTAVTAASREKGWLCREAHIDLTSDELTHFKACADKQNADQKSWR